MGAVLGEEAVRIQTDFTRLTGTVLRQIIRSLASSHANTGRCEGQMSLKALSAQGRQLESVEVPGEDVQRLRRELKKYHVDFTVMRDKETGKCEVYFKSQDVERVYKGLEHVVADWDKNADRKSAKELFAEAKKEAARRQAARTDRRQELHKEQEVCR